MEPKPSNIVFNWGVGVNVVVAVLEAISITLPLIQDSLPKTAYAVSALIIAAMNAAWIAFKQAQVNNLSAENDKLKNAK